QDLFDGEGSLVLRRNILEVDVHRFRQALQDGRIADARALWRGGFLEGFAIPSSRQWENWVEDFRSDLERRFQQGLLARALELRRSEAPEEALAQLRTAIELNPNSETVQRARIEILLELLRLGEAREAMADAWGAVGDHPGAREWLQEMERRLEAVVRERRSGGQEAEGLTLEFVGRSRELALLRRTYEEAMAGRTRVVVVTGVAGIGKTRLAEEFLRGTAGEDTLRVVVKGSRAEMKLRWGGVARLVRQLLLLPGSAGISSASDSLLRAMIPSLGRDTVNLETVNGVSPVALLDAVGDLLEAVSFEAPLVVHLDDLQWFDGESRALFLSLLARPGSFRTLFVITGRPDLSSSNWKSLQDSLVRDAGAASLTLEALDLAEVRELLALMAEFSDPEEGEALVHRIHRASGGNPLFLRGLLQQLSDQGVVHGTEDGSWVLDTGALPGEFSFPADIRALLNERLDRLSPEGALLAGVLARHGRPMAPVDLQRAMGDGHGKPADAVAELLEREVVRWVDGEALDFCHDLLREAALEHLRFAAAPSGASPGRRRSWTRRPGAVLAAGVLLAVSLTLIWGGGGPGLGEEPAPPPFGGGTLVMARAEGPPAALEISAGPPGGWAPLLLEGAPEGRVTEVHREPEGSVVLYGVMDLPLGPDMLRYLPDGSSRALFPADGDQALLDLSPEGGRVLFRSQDMTLEGFSVDLYWGVPETGETHLLHRGSGLTIGDAKWSGDGDLVAFMIQT
ncbi:MAG: AAA family ATPase, partial [Gemmatimonadota bacterium]